MKIKIFLSFILIFTFTQSQGQFFKRLQKRVERSVEETIIRKSEQKAAEKTSEAIDEAIERENKETKTNNNDGNSSTSVSTSNVGVDTEPSRSLYKFTGAISFSIDNQGQTINTEFLYSKNDKYLAIYMDMSDHGANGSSITVMEADNVSSYINTSGMKMKISSLGKMMDKIKENSVNEESMASVKKTGRKRVILGYNCEEYLLISEDTEVLSWVTTELDIPNMYFENKKDSAMKGFVLEYKAKTENGDVYVKVTKVNTNEPFILDTSEYINGF